MWRALSLMLALLVALARGADEMCDRDQHVWSSLSRAPEEWHKRPKIEYGSPEWWWRLHLDPYGEWRAWVDTAAPQVERWNSN